MRTKIEIWAAIRRADYQAAHGLLKELRARQETPDEHLVLAAMHVAIQTNGSYREMVTLTDVNDSLSILDRLADAFASHRWSTCIDLQHAPDSDIGLQKDVSAFAAWIAAEAAMRQGDDHQAVTILRASLGLYARNPLILTTALCLNLRVPFLDCPDKTLVELADSALQLSSQYFMYRSWQSICQGIAAWFDHRDGDSECAKGKLAPYVADRYPYPYDLNWLLPFLHDMDPKLASQVVARNFPLTYFDSFKSHILYSGVTGTQKQYVLNECRRRFASHLESTLLVAESYCEDNEYEKATRLLHTVSANEQRSLRALRLGVRTSLAANDPDVAVLYARELIQCSSHPAAAFDWSIEYIQGRYPTIPLQGIVDEWMGHSLFRDDGDLDRDSLAIGLLVRELAYDILSRFLSCVFAHDGFSRVLFLLGLPACNQSYDAILAHASVRPTIRIAIALQAADRQEFEIARAALDSAVVANEELSDEVQQFLSLTEEMVGRQFSILSFASSLDDIEKGLSIMSKSPLYLGFLRQVTDQLLSRGLTLELEGFLKEALQRKKDAGVLLFVASALAHRLNDFAAAQSIIEQNTDLAASSASSWRFYCQLLDETDQLEKWERVAQSGMSLHPNTTIFAVESALVSLRRVRLDESWRGLRDALERDPCDVRGLKALRKLAQMLDRLEDVVSIFQKAYDVDPGSQVFLDELIAVLERIEDQERALMYSLARRIAATRDDDSKSHDGGPQRLARLRNRILSEYREPFLAQMAVFEECLKPVQRAVSDFEALCPGTLLGVLGHLVNDGPTTPSPARSVVTARELLVITDFRRIASDDREQLRGGITEMVQGESLCDVKSRFIDIVEVWSACRQDDFRLLRSILGSVSLIDSAFVRTVRLLAQHCADIRDKCDDLVMCYVAAGSFTRGEMRTSSDIDAWLILDDSRVADDEREAFRERHRDITLSSAEKCRLESTACREVNVQIYLLSSAWRRLHEADPILLSLVEDGVPFFDRGLFCAWHQLLRRNLFIPTPEAIDRRLSALRAELGNAKRAVDRLSMDLLVVIKRGFLAPLEMLLQLNNLPATHYRDVLQRAQEKFCSQTGQLRSEDFDRAWEAIETVKAAEKGLSLDPERVLRLVRAAEDFEKRCELEVKAASIAGEKKRLRIMSEAIAAILPVSSTECGRSSDSAGCRLREFDGEIKSALELSDEAPWTAIRIASLSQRIPEMSLLLDIVRSKVCDPHLQ